jgi:hypothetical protein
MGRRIHKGQRKPTAYLQHVGECFDETQEYVRLDGWRGYAKPKYSVHCEPDTGGWDDSPYPNATQNLKAKLSELKAKKIPTKVVTLETSNVFCVNHFIIVPPKFSTNMITKHDLEYVGHECMADYFESIALQIEQNELSTANDMKYKLSRQQLRDFEDFISEAYYYESYDNTFH